MARLDLLEVFGDQDSRCFRLARIRRVFGIGDERHLAGAGLFNCFYPGDFKVLVSLANGAKKSCELDKLHAGIVPD